MLMEDMLRAFKMLKKACLETPVPAFADFNKPFILENDESKLDWELCYHRNRLMANTMQYPTQASL